MPIEFFLLYLNFFGLIMGNDLLKNKRILVTGAIGTIGAELVSLLSSDSYSPMEVIALDNNESGLFFLEQQFLKDSRAGFFLADIR